MIHLTDPDAHGDNADWLRLRPVSFYAESEARDERGRWTLGGEASFREGHAFDAATQDAINAPNPYPRRLHPPVDTVIDLTGPIHYENEGSPDARPKVIMKELQQARQGFDEARSTYESTRLAPGEEERLLAEHERLLASGAPYAQIEASTEPIRAADDAHMAAIRAEETIRDRQHVLWDYPRSQLWARDKLIQEGEMHERVWKSQHDPRFERTANARHKQVQALDARIREGIALRPKIGEPQPSVIPPYRPAPRAHFYTDDQPRDEHGRWTSGGGSSTLDYKGVAADVKGRYGQAEPPVAPGLSVKDAQQHPDAYMQLLAETARNQPWTPGSAIPLPEGSTSDGQALNLAVTQAIGQGLRSGRMTIEADDKKLAENTALAAYSVGRNTFIVRSDSALVGGDAPVNDGDAMVMTHEFGHYLQDQHDMVPPFANSQALLAEQRATLEMTSQLATTAVAARFGLDVARTSLPYLARYMSYYERVTGRQVPPGLYSDAHRLQSYLAQELHLPSGATR